MTFACLTIIETDVGKHLSCSSVLEQETQKNSFGLIAQFDLPGLKKGSTTLGRMEGGKKRKMTWSDGNKFVLGRGTRAFQVQQVRTNYGIIPTVAKYLTELLCSLLLHYLLAKAQAALTSARKSTDPAKEEES